MRTLLLLLIFLACTSPTPKGGSRIEELIVDEMDDDRTTAITKQNLLHLAQVFDLHPFLFNPKVRVKSQGRSYSHPKLTLNTKFFEAPHKLLGQWLHEELYWWLDKHPQELALAISGVKAFLPRKDLSEGLYRRVLVAFISYQILIHFLSKNEARTIVVEYVKKDDFYPWSYAQALNFERELLETVQRNKLLPPPLN